MIVDRTPYLTFLRAIHRTLNCIFASISKVIVRLSVLLLCFDPLYLHYILRVELKMLKVGDIRLRIRRIRGLALELSMGLSYNLYVPLVSNIFVLNLYSFFRYVFFKEPQYSMYSGSTYYFVGHLTLVARSAPMLIFGKIQNTNHSRGGYTNHW